MVYIVYEDDICCADRKSLTLVSVVQNVAIILAGTFYRRRFYGKYKALFRGK
jgi:hypothetical protein